MLARCRSFLLRGIGTGPEHPHFELVPGAGHVANLDNPDAFNRLLAAFLPPAP